MKRTLSLFEIDGQYSYRNPTELRWFCKEETTTLFALGGLRLRLPPAEDSALPASVGDTVYVSCITAGEFHLRREGQTDYRFTVGMGSAETPQVPLVPVNVVWSGFSAEIGVGVKVTVQSDVSEIATSVSSIQVLSLRQGETVLNTKAGLGYAVTKLLEAMELVNYDVTISDVEREDDDEDTVAD